MKLADLIKQNDFNGVRNLLDSEPEALNESTPEAPSMILLAVYCGRNDIANLLRERKGALSLHEAAAMGDIHELARHQPPFEEASEDGFFPLGYSAFFGHSEATRWLLDRGAPADQVSQNTLGVTALHASLSNGHKEIAKLLIERGANVDAVQGGESWTPLHYCAYYGDRETADLILSKSPCLDSQDKQGRTPADLAEERGFTDLAEILRPKGA
jgi:ankyrin repeat protein